MSVFAVSDLHLSLNTADKGMDVFGRHWAGHWESIRRSWLEQVTAEDVVVIAGDISWGISYDEALPDLRAVCDMPGKKILIKGNHDFWHAGLSKTRSLLYNEAFFLQNDAAAAGGHVFIGTRCWRQPTDPKFTAEDRKIWERELQRLQLSIKAAEKLQGPRIGIAHYPPFAAGKTATPFTDAFAEAGCEVVIFGHIHGSASVFSDYAPCEIDGVRYELTSCDYLGFKVSRIL